MADQNRGDAQQPRSGHSRGLPRYRPEHSMWARMQTALTTVDVIKSRIQLQGTGDWSFPGLYRIAQQEGIGALYKGFAPKVGVHVSHTLTAGPAVSTRWRSHAAG